MSHCFPARFFRGAPHLCTSSLPCSTACVGGASKSGMTCSQFLQTPEHSETAAVVARNGPACIQASPAQPPTCTDTASRCAGHRAAACRRALHGSEVGGGVGAADGQRRGVVRMRGVLLTLKEAQVVHLRCRRCACNGILGVCSEHSTRPTWACLRRRSTPPALSGHHGHLLRVRCLPDANSRSAMDCCCALL